MGTFLKQTYIPPLRQIIENSCARLYFCWVFWGVLGVFFGTHLKRSSNVLKYLKKSDRIIKCKCIRQLLLNDTDHKWHTNNTFIFCLGNPVWIEMQNKYQRFNSSPSSNVKTSISMQF